MHELIHLLTNPAHWAFEVITDIALAVPAYFIGKWRVRVHDKKVHGRGVQND